MLPTEPFLDDLAAVLRFFFDIFGVTNTRANLLVPVGRGREANSSERQCRPQPRCNMLYASLKLIGSHWFPLNWLAERQLVIALFLGYICTGNETRLRRFLEDTSEYPCNDCATINPGANSHRRLVS